MNFLIEVYPMNYEHKWKPFMEFDNFDLAMREYRYRVEQKDTCYKYRLIQILSSEEI